MNIVEKVLRNIIIAMFALMVILVLIQIAFRYVFSSPLGWTDELSRYLFIWVSLLGAAVGVRKKSHISIDFLVQKLNAKTRFIFSLATNSFIILFLVVLGIQSIKYANLNIDQLSPILGVSMSIMYSSLVIFSIISIIFLIENIVNIKKGAD